ncbi:MAG TPA: hypothetical protein VFQ88_07795 [Nevskiaceae bacterium]|nr:hypothetical protein [Nevskiaceae bacterium]
MSTYTKLSAADAAKNLHYGRTGRRFLWWCAVASAIVMTVGIAHQRIAVFIPSVLLMAACVFALANDGWSEAAAELTADGYEAVAGLARGEPRIRSMVETWIGIGPLHQRDLRRLNYLMLNPEQEMESARLACVKARLRSLVAREDGVPSSSRTDAELLEWVLRHLPGYVLRDLVGTMADTSDMDAFRAKLIEQMQGARHE